MLESIDLIRLTGARLRYLAERQNIIAGNIANADTPGFRARDLPPFQPQSPLLTATRMGAGAAPPLALARTEGDHLEGPGATTGSTPPQPITGKGYGEKPDGNRVSLEEQMEKAADTSDAFALASAAYAKSVSIMKTAIDVGR